VGRIIVRPVHPASLGASPPSSFPRGKISRVWLALLPSFGRARRVLNFVSLLPPSPSLGLPTRPVLVNRIGFLFSHSFLPSKKEVPDLLCPGLHYPPGQHLSTHPPALCRPVRTESGPVRLPDPRLFFHPTSMERPHGCFAPMILNSLDLFFGRALPSPLIDMTPGFPSAPMRSLGPPLASPFLGCMQNIDPSAVNLVKLGAQGTWGIPVSSSPPRAFPLRAKGRIGRRYMCHSGPKINLVLVSCLF